MKKRKVGITELILRDGHQSLIATRLKTEDMLPITKSLDNAGFQSLEAWGGATFDSCIRFLREDPWNRLSQLRQALPNTPLQMLLRGRNLLGYRPYTNDVVHAFVKQAANTGMDIFRIFDAMNDFENMKEVIKEVKKVKKHAQGTICYTTSPVHNSQKFLKLALLFADSGCDSIVIKDMAGIMAPEACFQLVRDIKDKINLPIHIHTHYTSGLAPLTQLRAIEAGADVIDTVISPFSGGSSHPATETMNIMLEERGIETGLKTEELESIAEYFQHIRKKYWEFESKSTGVDPTVLKHHVPGGMISNLVNQLREQDCLEKLPDVLKEIPEVRKDFGYPPLVTPTSQIVAAQSTLNVIGESRYANLSQESKHYLEGGYGKIPGKVDAKLLKQVEKEKKGKKIAKFNPKNKEMDSLRNNAFGLIKNDNDLLIYAMFPEIGKTFLQEQAAGQLKPLELQDPQANVNTSKPMELSDSSEYEITIHGETYNICLTGLGNKKANRRLLYFTVDGVSEEVLLESSTLSADVSKMARAMARAQKNQPLKTLPDMSVQPFPVPLPPLWSKKGKKSKPAIQYWSSKP